MDNKLAKHLYSQTSVVSSHPKPMASRAKYNPLQTLHSLVGMPSLPLPLKPSPDSLHLPGGHHAHVRAWVWFLKQRTGSVRASCSRGGPQPGHRGPDLFSPGRRLASSSLGNLTAQEERPKDPGVWGFSQQTALSKDRTSNQHFGSLVRHFPCAPP